jgi:hypothetical protein
MGDLKTASSQTVKTGKYFRFIVAFLIIIAISSCSLFEKEETDTRDPNNILDWVKVPPVGAQFAFYTFVDSSHIYYDTFSVLSVDTILYNIYIFQEIKWSRYEKDSLETFKTDSLFSIINTRDNHYNGHTLYTNLYTPVSESTYFFIDVNDYSKYMIESLNVNLTVNNVLYDSLILISEYIGNTDSVYSKIYFSPKYGVNVYESLTGYLVWIPPDGLRYRELTWVNY